MTSTITTGGKNFLAQYAGSGGPSYCYKPQGSTIQYYMYNNHDCTTQTSYTGGTIDVASALWVANTMCPNAVVVAGKSYADFKAANGNIDLVLDDITWIYNNDGHSGTTAYCYTCLTPVCGFVIS